jgi:hypothetical protein
VISWFQAFAFKFNLYRYSSALSTYTPRLKLNPNVLRVPIVPGCDPKKAYGGAGRLSQQNANAFSSSSSSSSFIVLILLTVCP